MHFRFELAQDAFQAPFSGENLLGNTSDLGHDVLAGVLSEQQIADQNIPLALNWTSSTASGKQTKYGKYQFDFEMKRSILKNAIDKATQKASALSNPGQNIKNKAEELNKISLTLETVKTKQEDARKAQEAIQQATNTQAAQKDANDKQTEAKKALEDAENNFDDYKKKLKDLITLLSKSP